MSRSSRGARGGKTRLGWNQPRIRGGNPAGFGLRGCRCFWEERLRLRGETEQQGSPRGARPALQALLLRKDFEMLHHLFGTEQL